MVSNNSKYLIIIGALLVLIGVGGSLISAADLLGVSFASYEEWEQSQAEEGFAPLALPVGASTEAAWADYRNPPLATLTADCPR